MEFISILLPLHGFLLVYITVSKKQASFFLLFCPAQTNFEQLKSVKYKSCHTYASVIIAYLEYLLEF